MLRGLAEYLSRRVVFKRRLPADLGRAAIYVSPAACLAYWVRSLERTDPMLLRFVREHVRPGHTVWDIGANVGLFSFAAASRAGGEGSILAIEADEWLAGLLRRSSAQRAEGMAPVSVLSVAVAERLGVAEFSIARRGRASNFLQRAGGSSQAGGVRESRLSMTVTLDWLLETFAPPDVLKIDIEGAELMALSAARRLLSSARPVILCEVAQSNRAAVTAILKQAGYDLYDASDRGGRPVEGAVANTLAISADRELFASGRGRSYTSLA